MVENEAEGFTFFNVNRCVEYEDGFVGLGLFRGDIPAAEVFRDLADRGADGEFFGGVVGAGEAEGELADAAGRELGIGLRGGKFLFAPDDLAVLVEQLKSVAFEPVAGSAIGAVPEGDAINRGGGAEINFPPGVCLGGRVGGLALTLAFAVVVTIGDTIDGITGGPTVSGRALRGFAAAGEVGVAGEDFDFGNVEDFGFAW